jgi:filamentous hemagglutinin family protein
MYRNSMNHIYRLIWSEVLNGWVAVAESSRGRGKGSSRKLVAAALSLCAATGQAAPAGAELVSGAGSISQSGPTTTIQQSSPILSLNWQSFNVAPQETVNFRQPSAAAIAVNRIYDTNGTQILGQLNANGQVWLVNPNGILFGQGAQVNVGGLVASTLDFNDTGLNGNARTFSGNGTGSVVNQGTINAAARGYVALLGNVVSNQGTITARLGSVALGAGSAATLTFNGNSLIKMQVDQGVLNTLAENGGLIAADGGTVIMNAGAKNALLASVVNNTGVIEARTVENHEGTIILLGGMTAGAVNVGGTLDASAPDGGNGGFIETSAAQVKVASEARVTTAGHMGLTGTWLIDPVDFTIAAGSATQTTSGIGASTLTNSLMSANVNIATDGATAGNGDIFVNDAVSWAANNLTLSAHRNININANLNASGTASLALEYGQGAVELANTGNYALSNGVQVNLPAGSNFSTKLGSDGAVTNYTVITSLGEAGSTTGSDLQGMSGALGGKYVVGGNIDATATSSWNSNAGFTPIGNATTKFTGAFDGLGHTVSGLTINLPTTDYVGLFGYTSGSTIRNVGLMGGSVSGRDFVGGLLGLNWGAVSNSYATGNVSSGRKNVGGLAGSTLGAMSNVWATGDVRNVTGGIGFVGGLVGNSGTGGTITNAYATGTVGGTGPNVGGLVGFNSNSTISNAYATGNVSGTLIVGGLVGYGFGAVSNSYATGSVTGTGTYVGGLVGYNDGARTISNAYATGSVSGAGADVGGLVGRNLGTIRNSYWNTQTSGQSSGIGTGTNTGATGHTSAEMMSMASFIGLDIANTGGGGAVWRIYEGNTTPWLTWFLTPLTVTVNSDSKTYNGVAYSGSNGLSYSVPPNPALSGVLAFGGAAQGAINAGSYPITASGLYSVQQGNDISYVAGALTVNQATLSLSGTRVYDSTTTFAGSNLTATGVNGESFAIGGTGDSSNLGSKDVQIGQSLSSLTGLFLGSSGNGGLAANYGNLTIAATPTSVSVTPKPITASGITANDKVYNANDVAILNTGAATLTGGAATDVDNKFYDADLISLNAGGATGVFVSSPFALGKDVGTAKAVSVSGLTLNNNAAGNYMLTGASGTTADIAAKAITASGILGVNKVYNTTLVAAITGGVLTGGATADGDTKFYTGDAISLDTSSANGAFATKDVGVGKAVSVSGLALSNNAAGNYTLAGANLVSADIRAKPITASGITANNKVYNANDVAILNTGAATLTGGAATDVDNRFYDGDAVSLDSSGANGAFATKDVGVGKAVSVSGLALSNNAAGNYTLTGAGGTTANITKAPLTVTADDKSRLYGAANPTFTETLSGFLPGETSAVITGTPTGSSAAGSGTGVGTSAITANATGLSAINYEFTTFIPGTLTITPAPLTVTANADGKTYNGVAYSGGNGVAYSGFVNSETPSALGGTLTYGGTSQGATDAGSYVIAPGGLISGNYTVSYVDGMLTIRPATQIPQPGTVLEPVVNATSQLQSELTSFNVLDQHQTLLLSPTIGGEANSYLKEVVVVGNKETRINIGGLGPILRVLEGGVRLPGNLVMVNE